MAGHESTTDVIVHISDMHARSTVAVCPPIVELDDGGSYHASSAQVWLWNHWLDFWNIVAAVRDEYQAGLFLTFNGDMVDGDHHNTPQIVSRLPGVEFAIADALLNVPMALGPDAVFVVRGTESHVGKSGSTEEGLAKLLIERGHPVQGDPNTGTASWWHLRMEVQGLLYDVAHHGRTGYRPWTRANASAMYAAQIFYEHASRGKRHPDYAIRSHFHTWNDSYDAHPTRVIQLPAWQLATAYVHRKIPDAIADVGGLIQVVRDGAVVHENKVNYKPKDGHIWRKPA